jgi:hypothetical protein
VARTSGWLDRIYDAPAADRGLTPNSNRATARLSERIGEFDLTPKDFDPVGGFFGSQVILEQLRLVCLDRQ